jgi:hypothetical protein
VRAALNSPQKKKDIRKYRRLTPSFRSLQFLNNIISVISAPLARFRGKRVSSAEAACVFQSVPWFSFRHQYFYTNCRIFEKLGMKSCHWRPHHLSFIWLSSAVQMRRTCGTVADCVGLQYWWDSLENIQCNRNILLLKQTRHLNL